MSSGLLERRGPAPGLGRPGPPPSSRPDGSDPGRAGEGRIGDSARIGLLAFLGTVTMLFLGFSSALLLRRASPDWRPLAAPGLLYLSSGALVLSSLALEVARRRLRGWDLPGAEGWTWATGALGACFVAGQLGAWRQLAAQGVFLSSNPSSSFFYVLTGVHAVHVLGGLVWFAAVAWRLRRLRLLPGADGLALFATYWHYLGAVWLYLLVLMFGS